MVWDCVIVQRMEPKLNQEGICWIWCLLMMSSQVLGPWCDDLMFANEYVHFCTSQIRATKMVYGVEPDLTREGGSIPVTLTLQVVLLWTWHLCWLLMAGGCWSLIVCDSLMADGWLQMLSVNITNCDKVTLFRRPLERMWSCCQWVPLTMVLTLRMRRLT